MKIWVLAKKKNFRNYENKRIVLEAEKMGMDLTLVAPEDFEIIEPQHEEKKEAIIYKKKWTELPDCVITRMGSGATYFSLAVMRYFEKMGVYVCNNSQSVEYSKDKLHSFQILAQSNIPIPKTMLAKSPINPRIIKKEFNFPLILKMKSGSYGRGVLLCEDMAQLTDISELTEISSGGKLNLIIQEFVSNSKGKDLRVFVVGGRAVGAILRTAGAGKFKANYTRGGSVENYTLTPEIEWIAVESARMLDLEIAGVDILFDKEGYKVCEVNSAPGFEGFEDATGINVPEEILSFAKVRLEGSVLSAPKKEIVAA